MSISRKPQGAQMTCWNVNQQNPAPPPGRPPAVSTPASGSVCELNGDQVGPRIPSEARLRIRVGFLPSAWSAKTVPLPRPLAVWAARFLCWCRRPSKAPSSSLSPLHTRPAAYLLTPVFCGL